MKNNTSFAVNGITYALLLSLAGAPAYAVDFNTDVLDAADRILIFPGSPRRDISCPGSTRWKLW